MGLPTALELDRAHRRTGADVSRPIPAASRGCGTCVKRSLTATGPLARAIDTSGTSGRILRASRRGSVANGHAVEAMRETIVEERRAEYAAGVVFNLLFTPASNRSFRSLLAAMGGPSGFGTDGTASLSPPFARSTWKNLRQLLVRRAHHTPSLLAAHRVQPRVSTDLEETGEAQA